MNVDVRKIGYLDGRARRGRDDRRPRRRRGPHQADDPTLASREGIFDLSGFAARAVLRRHLRRGRRACSRSCSAAASTAARREACTVGRRLAQVGAPIAAVAARRRCAAVASNSDLGEPHREAAGDDRRRSRHGDTATAARDRQTRRPTGDMPHDETAARRGRRRPRSHEDHGHGPVIAGTATGDSPCEIASPTPASPGQVGDRRQRRLRGGRR